eukprot:3406899-Amphidinium_carterae.1
MPKRIGAQRFNGRTPKHSLLDPTGTATGVDGGKINKRGRAREKKRPEVWKVMALQNNRCCSAGGLRDLHVWCGHPPCCAHHNVSLSDVSICRANPQSTPADRVDDETLEGQTFHGKQKALAIGWRRGRGKSCAVLNDIWAEVPSTLLLEAPWNAVS